MDPTGRQMTPKGTILELILEDFPSLPGNRGNCVWTAQAWLKHMSALLGSSPFSLCFLVSTPEPSPGSICSIRLGNLLGALRALVDAAGLSCRLCAGHWIRRGGSARPLAPAALHSRSRHQQHHSGDDGREFRSALTLPTTATTASQGIEHRMPLGFEDLRNP